MQKKCHETLQTIPSKTKVEKKSQTETAAITIKAIGMWKVKNEKHVFVRVDKRTQVEEEQKKNV